MISSMSLKSNSLLSVSRLRASQVVIGLNRRFISVKLNFDKLKINPPPPGGVIGDVNQPYKPPQADFYHGSYHWLYERTVAASLLPLSMYSIYVAVTGSVIYPYIDIITGVSALFYLQYEFLSCITDYIPKRKFKLWHTFAKMLLYSGSAIGFYGLYEIETINNGLNDLIYKFFVDDESNLYIFGKY